MQGNVHGSILLGIGLRVMMRRQSWRKRIVSMASLDSGDREAISQLRVLLRGEHRLTLEQEEELIAAYLAGRSPVVAFDRTEGSDLSTRQAQWRDIVMQPLVVQAGAVSISALISVQHAAFSGVSLYLYNYRANMSVAFLAAAVGLFLLALFPVRAWLGHRLSRASQLTCTAISSFVGAELLEYAALHWPTDSPFTAIHTYLQINLLTLFVAALVAVGTAAFGLAQQRVGSAPTNRRLGTEQQPRLPGHIQG
jgi:hypothetical protein